MAKTSIIWFRHDLRLRDNPALRAAVNASATVVPVFIWSPEEEAPWEPGAASRWWLHHSLRSLQRELRRRGAELLICRGPAAEALLRLAKATGAATVFLNRRYEPAVRARDERVEARLQARGIECHVFNGALLHEPEAIQNRSGRPFQVFTPFWKCCLEQCAIGPPLPAPARISIPQRLPKSVPLESLGLEPKMDWAAGLRAEWQPGEDGALARLRRFLKRSADYPTRRDRPDLAGTSRLSPHLHFGEISPRQVWHSLQRQAGDQAAFRRELGWREFGHHLLFHFPRTAQEPLRGEFSRFPWRRDARLLAAWKKGRTGYPMVDAGMRQLWATGWMHNRVRMITASFLVKDLLIDWKEGARWFWDTLVDADVAQNTLGWQWSAGCGADAAPFFRIFNPVAQGEKFDPTGDYVRKWCPELAKVPVKWTHQPWKAHGHDYPPPVVKHRIAREVALEAFRHLKSRVA